MLLHHLLRRAALTGEEGGAAYADFQAADDALADDVLADDAIASVGLVDDGTVNAAEDWDLGSLVDIFNNGTHNSTLLSKEHLACLSEWSHTDPLDGPHCPASWDRVLCWPPTPAGTKAVQHCFEQFNGVLYDSSENATRLCLEDGNWSSYSNYTLCRDLPPPPIESGIETTTTIYFAGYTMSLVALTMAVTVFWHFKELRCLRNAIHANLMCAYILADFTWILNLTLQVRCNIAQTDHTSCVILILLLHYSTLTNFFWMFVEGLYLYTLVVETFQRGTVRLRVYLVIGWGTPVFFVVLWVITRKLLLADERLISPLDQLWRQCPWMSPHWTDWFYQAPAIAVLLVNLFFLVLIMYVLITKLRSATTAETQQYRKATKALLVLIPLLGITYFLVMAGPTEGKAANIFAHARAVLLSTQGLLVALLYCFLNSDVRTTMRHHWERWRAQRSLGGGRRRERNGGNSYTYSWANRDTTAYTITSGSGPGIATGRVAVMVEIPRNGHDNLKAIIEAEDHM